MGKKFQRKIENFTCGVCATKVIGTGYTNHCPNCLWSKHVDINPGDRAEECKGLMKPVSTEKKGESINIIHKCQSCGFTRKNKRQEDDNLDAILEIMENG